VQECLYVKVEEEQFISLETETLCSRTRKRLHNFMSHVDSLHEDDDRMDHPLQPLSPAGASLLGRAWEWHHES
jgi:hypothetical protein